jgi:hypothetical protein
VYVEIYDKRENKTLLQRWSRLVASAVDTKPAATTDDVDNCGDQPDCYICNPFCGYIKMYGISGGAPEAFPYAIALKGWREDGTQHLTLGPYKGQLGPQLGLINDESYDATTKKLELVTDVWGSS